MLFQNLKFAKKLALGFGILLCVTVMTSMFIYHEITGLAEVERRNYVSDQAEAYIKQLQSNLATARAAVRTFELTSDPGQKDVAANALKNFTNNSEILRGLLTRDAPDLLTNMTAYESAITVYLNTGLNEELRLASSPETLKDAIEFLRSGRSGKSYTPVVQTSAALDKSVTAWSSALIAEANGNMARISATVAGSAIFCVLFGALAAWLLTRSIGRPIAAMTATMNSLAQGDNAVAIPAIGQTDEIGEMAKAVQVFKNAAIEKLRLEHKSDADQQAIELERKRTETEREVVAQQLAIVVESLAGGLSRLSKGDLTCEVIEVFAPNYERLRTDFNAALCELRGVVGSIITNTGTIRSGAGEITQAADELSRRTEQQAASLKQTAAALDEITATVRKTADSANATKAVVASANLGAERGQVVVGDAVAAMSEIEKSAKEIGYIVGVIDEIAFQTNLLALNAGVEAARAGDSGRGFAVVASEVRALAQRSAEASKEIKVLIMTSTAQVGRGVTLVQETGTALGRILADVSQINGAVRDIAAGAQEQSTGLAQINIAVNQMDQMTQQNAAMVEESTTASHHLAQDAAELEVLTARFKIETREPRLQRRFGS